MTRWIAAPFRMALGLHPFWGLTVKCRVLQILRSAGLYGGVIDFVFMAPAGHIGLTGKGT
jgi:hypothetical protein